MKIVLISDTHNQHEKIKLPKGDMIIHAGDVSGRGTFTEVLNFLQWFSKLPYQHKIFIAGNHDFLFERQKLTATAMFPEGVTYLENSEVTIEGIRIYGSPFTVKFYDWAFMKYPGEEMAEIWKQIPKGIDILITHGPPFEILDENISGMNRGCKDLLKRVRKVRPRIHVFGHIHEGYGSKEIDGTTFYNASILNDNYRVANSPIVVEMK